MALTTLILWLLLPWCSLNVYAAHIEGSEISPFAMVKQTNWLAIQGSFFSFFFGAWVGEGVGRILLWVAGGAFASLCVAGMIQAAYRRGLDSHIDKR